MGFVLLIVNLGGFGGWGGDGGGGGVADRHVVFLFSGCLRLVFNRTVRLVMVSQYERNRVMFESAAKDLREYYL